MSFQERELKIESIGKIDVDNGSDEYALLKGLDDDLTPEQAVSWLKPRMYRESTQPGGYFCTTVRGVQVPFSKNQVICIVEHRYDV